MVSGDDSVTVETNHKRRLGMEQSHGGGSVMDASGGCKYCIASVPILDIGASRILLPTGQPIGIFVCLVLYLLDQQC